MEKNIENQTKYNIYKYGELEKQLAEIDPNDPAYEAKEMELMLSYSTTARLRIELAEYAVYCQDKVKTIDDKISELKNIKAHYEGHFDKAVNVIKKDIEENGMPDLIGTTIEIKARKSQSVEIINENALPEEVIDTVISKKPNKTKIKDYIKRNGQITGAEIRENTNITIKGV